MIIYIDKEYKCYTTIAEDRTAIETEFFDGKCKTFIEGYCFVPAGQEWIREDGEVFQGEMITPWRNMEILQAAQQTYEESLDEMQDMTEALNIMGVELDG